MTKSYRNLKIEKRPRLSVTVPERAGPHVKLVFAEMQRQGFTYDDVEFGAGVMRATLKAWRVKNYPALQNIEAALGFLGFDFVPIPRASVLPPEVVAELRPVAEKLKLDMPKAIQALVEIVAGVHDSISNPRSTPSGAHT